MAELRGSEVSMLDGTVVVTEITSDKNRRDDCLTMLLHKMYEHGDMVVGFDLEWPLRNNDHSLLTLANQFGCLMIKLEYHYSSGDARFIFRRFFSHKDIIFVGVHIREDVKKMWDRFGIQIRNVVDLSELAADVLRQPRLSAFGVRQLAHEVLSLPFKARHFSKKSIENCSAWSLAVDQIECASTDAYAAYKIAKKLLGA